MTSKTPESTRRTLLFAALKGGWLKTAAEVAGILSLVVAIIAIVVQTSGSATPTPAAAPSTAPDQEHRAARPDLTLFDDFSGSEIDSSKWSLSSENTVAPYVEDGKLHLEVTPADGPGNHYSTLRAELRGAITDVSYEMTLVSREGNNTGGGYGIAYTHDDRRHKVALKPNTDHVPTLDYYICRKETCEEGDYEDFWHPEDSPPIQIGRTYHVHIYQDDRGWVFDVDGFQPVIADIEDSPIENFEFYLYSNKGTFQVTVDNVQVAYA